MAGQYLVLRASEGTSNGLRMIISCCNLASESQHFRREDTAPEMISDLERDMWTQLARFHGPNVRFTYPTGHALTRWFSHILCSCLVALLTCNRPNSLCSIIRLWYRAEFQSSGGTGFVNVKTLDYYRHPGPDSTPRRSAQPSSSWTRSLPQPDYQFLLPFPKFEDS